MKFVYCFLIGLAIIMGCSRIPDSAVEKSSAQRGPVQLRNVQGLRDCVYIEFWVPDNPTDHLIRAVRCPGSNVTTSWRVGKSGSISLTTTDEGPREEKFRN